MSFPRVRNNWSFVWLALLAVGCGSSTSSEGDAGAATADSAPVTADAGGVDGGSSRAVIHVEGAGELIAFFVTDEGIIAIRTDAVSLFDRMGHELATRAARSELTAAAFHGDVLFVADGTSVLALGAGLDERWSGDVTEPCLSLARVGTWLVCGVGTREEFVWRTLDPNDGSEISRSEPSHRGTVGFAVPGADAFMSLQVSTREVISGTPQPSLFLIDELGTPRAGHAVWDSFPFDSTAHAFIELPSRYLLTGDSSFLRFDGCDPAGLPRCFVPEGALGTISGYEQYIGLDSDQTRFVFGLIVGNGFLRDGGGYCRTSVPCRVQVFDLTTHEIVLEVPWDIEVENVVALRWDPSDDAVAVGWNDCDTEGHCSTWHIDGAALD